MATNKLKQLSNKKLLEALKHGRVSRTDLVEMLDDNIALRRAVEEMERAVREMKGADNELEAFRDLAASKPHAMKQVLDFALYAVSNCRFETAIEAELERREGSNADDT